MWMSTQFFERQETQKAQSRWLVWAFIGAILLVVAVINLVVLVGLGGNPIEVAEHEPWFIFWTSIVVLGIIFGACWHKSSEMREGGTAVARSLGGVPVTADSGDIKHKRLLNIVEEMALAARIRKPAVYVLPDEPGINAFAAGHSPDEAAVAVTQGALDQLDRDQLQAVIGHEFSHILNGDMKINMRLTAWIFGLLVITNLAGRVMRGRSRGKGAARIKMIAFGIFVAGSVGMLAGRLLQAAVSRRREHLADASSVQFTRNPQALQSAFVVMAASSEGSRLQHEGAAGVKHMFFAASDVAWANKFGGSWFSTHPPIEERVRLLDSRMSPSRFKQAIGEERRRQTAKAKIAEAAEASAAASAQAKAGAGDALPFAAGAAGLSAAMPMVAMAAAAAAPGAAPGAAPARSPATSGSQRSINTDGLSLESTQSSPVMAEETLPTGVRMVAGKTLPPDILRNRLSQDQQAAIQSYIAQVEKDTHAVQATYIAALLASEPAKWRTQLTKLAPVIGIELFKGTQAQIPRLASLAPASRLPLLADMLSLLDDMDPAHRKRLRGVARAFAPTVAIGDMLRYSVTRVLEKRLAKAKEQPVPVPLPERAQQVCELYASLAHCRFGVGKGGLNS
jgi:Zn-dependent protease with chaperone function